MGKFSFLIIIGLSVFLMAAKPTPSVTTALYRNSPPVVEQQGEGLSCTNWNTDPNSGITFWDGSNLDRCVTNTGDCVWDADDFLQIRHAGNGEISACTFADSMAHTWLVYVYDLAKRPLPMDVTLTFSPGVSESMHVIDGRGFMCVGGPDYDRQYLNYEIIPLQGGGGLVNGLAVPTTVTALFTGGRRPSLTIEARLSSYSYCPYSGFSRVDGALYWSYKSD